MLILAKFLAGKITKIFDFSKAKVLYFKCLIDKKRRGHCEMSISLEQFDATEIHLTSSLLNFLNTFFPFFFFIENVTISVFTVSSEEKLGSMVLPEGALDKFHQQCPCIETDSREQIKPFHPLKPSLSTQPLSRPWWQPPDKGNVPGEVSSQAAPLWTLMAGGEALATGWMT